MQSITGKITKVHFSSPNGKCTMGKIEVSKNTQEGIDEISNEYLREDVEYLFSSQKSITCGFKFFGTINEGETVKLLGEWKENKGYGPQFVSNMCTFIIPFDRDGLIRYISENPEFKGFGLSKATKLVYGITASRFSNILSVPPEDIAKIAKVSIEDAKHFKLVWSKKSVVNAIATQLASYDITHSQIEKIVKVFGDISLSVLKSNPYRLIGEVEGFGFSTVDKIALRVGVKKNDPNRIQAGISYTVLLQSELGHTWTEIETVIQEANKILILDDSPHDSHRLIVMNMFNTKSIKIEESRVSFV